MTTRPLRDQKENRTLANKQEDWMRLFRPMPCSPWADLLCVWFGCLATFHLFSFSFGWGRNDENFIQTNGSPVTGQPLTQYVRLCNV